MPGIIAVERDVTRGGPDAGDAELARLIGPPLDVPVQLAIDMLRNSFEKHTDNVAVASMFQPADYLNEIFATVPHLAAASIGSNDYLRWTYGQLKHAAELLAVALAERGVRENSTIAALIHGSLDFYLIFCASLILRCRFAPMNYHSITNPDEIRSMLTTVNAKVVFATDDKSMHVLYDNVPALADEKTLKVVVESPTSPGQANGLTGAYEYLPEMILAASAKGSKDALERFEHISQTPEDDVMVIFTSGTSALPKACPLTNNILTSIATNYGRGPASGPTAVTCNHLPIYHIAGIISGGWNPLANGGRIVHPAPSFTAKSTVDAIRQENVTFMVLVPSMIGLLLEDPALPPPSTMSIQNISLGASTILYTDVEKCYEFFGAKRVITSYGMTEGLMMTRGFLPREPTEAAINGIQRIAAGSRLKICAPGSNLPLPRGEAGEVHQGGASTIRGYIGKDSDNFYTDEDGLWCKTGDQAIMHADGGLQITGRYKDLIIRGGVNISPQAIEGLISRILNIEAHVVGIPDSIAGEVPVAIVRDTDIGRITPQSLRARIIKDLGPRFALEKFMTLKELGLNEFPKTSTGKIRKIDLQAAVRRYAQAKAASEQPSAGSGNGAEPSRRPTLARLISMWGEISGVETTEQTAKVPIQSMADSLMLARYTTTVRAKFGCPFTLADLEKRQTLEAQAVLLDSRGETESSTADLYTEQDGVPVEPDMALFDGTEGGRDTKQACQQTLHSLGFSWEDVQDVVIPSQWLQSWIKTRETSDRFRAAYVSTKADIAVFMDALTETLRRNDSLRAVSIRQPNNRPDLQVILRHTPKWLSKVIKIHPEPVATVKDLENLIPGDFRLSHGLAQIVVAHVEETGSAGCCLMTLHSTFDAFSLNTLRSDFNHLLNKKQPKQHVPYKLWADHLYNTQESAMAESSVKYNVQRLTGLASKRAALWPPQRTAVWQRGCDRGLHITPDGIITTPDDPNQRPLLDGAASTCTGSDGLRRETHPRDLATLTSTHNIPVPILVKAALVLLETRLTGQSDALFTQTFSMRDNWPFMDEWMSRRLPSPLEVTGPTLARVAEIVPVDRAESVMGWLKRLKREQEVLIKHCHAPYRFVFDELNRQSESGLGVATPIDPKSVDVVLTPPVSPGHEELVRDLVSDEHTDSAANTATTTNTTTETTAFLPPPLDGHVMESIRKRLNFQWLPTFQPDKGVKPLLRVASSSHFNEVGLAVKSGLMADHKTVWLKMEWDDGNIRREEAQAWIEEMARYVEVLGSGERWEGSVEEVYKQAGF